MNYRDELKKAYKVFDIVGVYIAFQVDANFTELTDEQFEQICDIINHCWECGHSIEETINFIIDKCYYSYEDDIQLFLDRNSAEEIESNMRR